ncbi:MAG: hypothetical protein DME00_20575 [Candidatus Rokuibacteriota bacterium]|nr:MAG: hypothetical protein DME00_20575 [Candidatus Rokubacteria bacterium]
MLQRPAEAQRNPALRDQPLVVGADPGEGRGRDVVTAASYATRRYGIRSALSNIQQI